MGGENGLAEEKWRTEVKFEKCDEQVSEKGGVRILRAESTKGEIQRRYLICSRHRGEFQRNKGKAAKQKTSWH